MPCLASVSFGQCSKLSNWLLLLTSPWVTGSHSSKYDVKEVTVATSFFRSRNSSSVLTGGDLVPSFWQCSMQSKKDRNFTLNTLTLLFFWHGPLLPCMIFSLVFPPRLKVEFSLTLSKKVLPCLTFGQLNKFPLAPHPCPPCSVLFFIDSGLDSGKGSKKGEKT